ncbi:Fur family transcriptional regulator [Actinospongicola halichondriae]|uniref:Fur family transcriptional regulator n=1 Tax=Actinospongicola halichondriae TaxID=3236844 RepID=UPI003D58C7D6
MSPTSARERIDAAIDRLRLDGERVTKARTALIEILAENDDHLCAEDIADRMEGDASSTHRATVYRTLESLVKAGIVAHVHLPHGAARYHLIDTDRAHLHLLCRDCGDIIDAPPDLLDEVRQRLDASTGFRLDPDHVALTGWCRSCRPDADA